MIVSAEDFRCPECDKIWEEELIEVGNEPFNGVYIECDCGKEFDITPYFNIMEI